MNNTRDRYLLIATKHTKIELAKILDVNPRTIRHYAQQTGVQPKVTRYRNRSLAEWVSAFDDTYNGVLTVADVKRDKQGRATGVVSCTACDTSWNAQLPAKLANKTGCVICDKGNHGNAYSPQDVEALLNEQHEGQWVLVKYGQYSSKRSVIRCTLCNIKRTVNLANMINTTSRRCTNCQTGSFGEYIIRNVLTFNGIPFDSEVPLILEDRRYRLDFLIDNRVALEYSGLQHFEEGPYYNEAVSKGVDVKRCWAIASGYRFHEIVARKTMSAIIRELVVVLERPMRTPAPTHFAKNNEAMVTVLTYMATHSARQTNRDLGVSVPKIRRYVQLAGYESISAWQAENVTTRK